MRPAGIGGVLFTQVLAWAGVALVCWAAWMLGRWYVVSYPDSLWLFVAIGVVAVAPAVGRVGRTSRDADAWGIEALVVTGALLAATIVLGPSCPTGGDCATIGVHGSLGTLLSVLVVLLAALAAWGLARWQQRSAEFKRPGAGRVSYGSTLAVMLGMFVFPGALVGAAFIGLDMLARSTPALARTAAVEVERECYGLTAAPDLAVRAAPNGYNPQWTTFAVRRSSESRPGVDGKDLDVTWATLDRVHPYEATVSFSADGQLVGVTCRKVGPGTGNAVKADEAASPPDSNPLSPKSTGSQFLPRFFAQGVAGPTEEGKKKAAAAAKAEAAKAKADAKADAEGAKADDSDGGSNDDAG